MFYNSEEKINEIFINLNQSLGTRNKILVFDFSHFHPITIYSQSYDLDIVLYGERKQIKKYQDDLMAYKNSGGNDWKMFDNKEVVFFDILRLNNTEDFEYNEDEQQSYKHLTLNNIHPKIGFNYQEELKNTFNTGKSLVIFSRNFASTQVSVYILMKEIVNEEDITIEIKNKIENLLINELINIGVKRNISLQEFKSYAIAHKHINRNYSFKNSLEILKKHIPKELVEKHQVIENTIIMRDLSTELFYSYTDGDSERVVNEFNCNSYIELLTIIYRSTTLYREIEILVINEEELKNHRLNIIQPSDFLDVFIVLSNLYSNTRIHSDEKEFKIVVDSSKENELCISFITNTTLENRLIGFLQNINENYLDENRGFTHVKKSLKKLNNISIEINVKKNKSEIKINVL